MNTEWLAQNLAEGSQRLSTLRNRAAQLASEPSKIVLESLAELDSTFEELGVVPGRGE
jgi:uncharacterized protein YciW